MAMKWVSVTEKDPEFKQEYVLMDKSGDWTRGHLQEKIETDSGKAFRFYDAMKGESATDITHFMKIEPPKNNQ